MSILDEELVVSDDNDFEDLFPTSKQDVDEEELETVIDDEEYEVEEAPKKKRGRPSKADAAKKSAAGKKKLDLDVKLRRDRFFDGVRKLSENGITLEAVVAVKPKIALGKYKGIKLEKIEYNVTDADIDGELERL